MKVLVANIGSSSFKFRLFDVAGDLPRELASGGVDRIGIDGGTMVLSAAGAETLRKDCPCDDHASAIGESLAALVGGGVLASPGSLDAVAFKAVMAGEIEPVVRVDEKVLAAMEYYAPVAPAHNPAYVAAMRSFREALGDTPLVAAFEPGFHRTIPPRRRAYAIPPEWAEKFGIRRYGYHGASHRYIAEHVAEVAPEARRVISCHLGGSSSICAIRDGESLANSMGFSPQSGLPQGTRAGEFDPFALAIVTRETGASLEEMLAALGGSAGLAGLSGASGDMRDIESAAAAGDERARLTLGVYVTAIRDYVGAYLVELGGLDALVFTGGIGQRSPVVRGGVCRDLGFAGIALDADANETTRSEGRIDSADSATAIWVMETNEELIVARQAAELLSSKKGADGQHV